MLEAYCARLFLENNTRNSIGSKEFELMRLNRIKINLTRGVVINEEGPVTDPILVF